MHKYKRNEKYNLPTSDGFFGEFGGRFTPPEMNNVLNQLEKDFNEAFNDENFLNEVYKTLQEVSNRPSPLYFAKKLTEHYGKGKIYLKREDLNYTGSHKINNVIGQALLAQRTGKKHLIAETGAGQHGVATATVAAYLGMKCTVFMGAEDIERQKLNVDRMRLLGADVHSVEFGTKTLKEAVDAAIDYWVKNSDEAFYVLGSTVGPHPYPLIVRSFQAIIGQEAKEQIMTLEGKLPNYVLACVGGGSNSSGIFYNFIDDKNVKLIGLEAGGKGVDTEFHGASLTMGKKVILHGMRQYALVDKNGEVCESYSISAGIDYPGSGPELCYLKDTGRAEFHPITDKEAVAAFKRLSHTEGIVPAIESAHALAYLEELMPKTEKDDIVIVNLSGRGDKDCERLIEQVE